MRIERHNLTEIAARLTAAGVRCRAFTLVELLVVIAIVLLILSVVGPSVTKMWDQRLGSQAETVVAGAIRSTQMQARTGGERGLFFYMDGDEQKIAPIRPVRKVKGQPDPIDQINVVADVFEVTDGMIYRVPPPFRVCPRNVVDECKPANDLYTWNEGELNNRDVFASPSTGKGNQRHCNFFSLVFGPDGRLRVGRNVLIYDGDETKDRTGLLAQRASSDPADQYYDAAGTPRAFPELYDGSPSRLENLVAANASGGVTALNFPCVDGVLVYDGTYYWDLPDADARREFIREKAIPYYVSRLTGDIIRGPVGE
ncbi:MAG: type II secretion system protein [Phycisphaerae bacterium]|nr:type II secretion system protein [Phycisphaerae bacterium]